MTIHDSKVKDLFAHSLTWEVTRRGKFVESLVSSENDLSISSKDFFDFEQMMDYIVQIQEKR